MAHLVWHTVKELRPKWALLTSVCLLVCSICYSTEKEAAATADYISYKVRGPTAHLNLGLTPGQRHALDRMSLQQLEAFLKAKGDVLGLGRGPEGGAGTAAGGDGGVEDALQQRAGGVPWQGEEQQQQQQRRRGAGAAAGMQLGTKGSGGAGAARETQGNDAADALEATGQQRAATGEQQAEVQQGKAEVAQGGPRGCKRRGQAQGPEESAAVEGEGGSSAAPRAPEDGPLVTGTEPKAMPPDNGATAPAAAAAAAVGSAAAAAAATAVNVAAADAAEATGGAPAAPSAQAGDPPAALPPSDGRPGASYRYAVQSGNKYRGQVCYNGGVFCRWAAHGLRRPLFADMILAYQYPNTTRAVQYRSTGGGSCSHCAVLY